ncbi:MAG: peptide deformylase [Verrucomicrobiota bacterium]|nr:peptide deformylase [Verrucomicrobiota bacterium]
MPKKLKVYCYDDPVLRKKALSIEEITPEIVELAEDMIETMIQHKGVGLSATQVGVLKRIFIIRDEWTDASGTYQLGPPEVIINATLSKPSEEKQTQLEGCLSLPGLYLNVARPKAIHVRYQNLKGEWIEEAFKDFRARVTMHENDHLNGVLIIDRTSKSERKKAEPHLLAIKKKYNP